MHPPLTPSDALSLRNADWDRGSQAATSQKPRPVQNHKGQRFVSSTSESSLGPDVCRHMSHTCTVVGTLCEHGPFGLDVIWWSCFCHLPQGTGSWRNRFAGEKLELLGVNLHGTPLSSSGQCVSAGNRRLVSCEMGVMTVPSSRCEQVKGNNVWKAWVRKVWGAKLAHGKC